MEVKKKIGILVIVLLVLILILLMVLFQGKLKKERDQVKTLFQDKERITAISDVISEQQEKSIEIQNILKNGDYTFENPYLIVDPYGLSPLTALVIFETNQEEEIEVIINDILVTKMEKSKVHSIPIYGLKAGVLNQVILKMNGQEKGLTIDRSEIELENLKVEVKNPEVDLNNELYFLSISDGDGAAAYDGNGNVVWDLVADYSLDIEFLKNGHMYLSNNHSSGVLESYDGFYEIDYFGKIHKNYSLENGYHHELVSLSDGTLIAVGGNHRDVPSYVGSFIYQIDLKTGKVLNSFDVYDLFMKIDQEFADKLLGKNIQVNSIYYDEETKEMVLSLKGINSILSLNFETKDISWIFGDPNFYSDKFQKYLLHVTDQSRYPKGQHTASITEEGYLSVFNNDFDQINSPSDDMMAFVDNYSSATLYKISDKNISTYWEYDADKKYFTYELGSFYTYSNHSKLINFGWTFYPDAYVPGRSVFDYVGNTYARIIDINQNDEVVFNATSEYGIYRAYKHRLYEETTKNYLDFDFQLINNNESSLSEKIKTDKIYDDLVAAIDSPYDFHLTVNTVSMNAIFDRSEVVDLYFVSEDSNTYIMNYKRENESASSVININLKGNYAVFLKINGVFYNTKKILSFSN